MWREVSYQISWNICRADVRRETNLEECVVKNTSNFVSSFQLPWLCFAHPILKSREYGQYEVRKAAKVMWFEKGYLWLQLLEKALVFPMIVLSALTMDLEAMKGDNHWVSAIILVVCGLKLFRSVFSDCSKQYMVLLVTLLYFQYNPQDGQVYGVNVIKIPRFQIPPYFILYYFLTSIVFHKLYEFYLKVQFVITYIGNVIYR